MHLHQILGTAFLILSTSYVISIAQATPIGSSGALHLVEDLVPLRARQSSESVFAITGVAGLGIQPRLEIRQLQQNADQWNLYLLGLQRMQQLDQSDKLSYYQIAGIHGRPFIAWDGVQAAPGAGGGYCTHVSNLFLPWHRPYLALYEQVLHSMIMAVANEFSAGSERQKYAAAALTWRQPYWDWAAAPSSNQSVYPSSVSSPTVSVITPSGAKTISNPLFAYRFHPVSTQDMFFNPFASWNTTKRYPTSWAIGATSQDGLVGEQLDNNRDSFQDRLYNLFTSYSNFSEFSTEAWYPDTPGSYDSLESLHDAIHAITGSSGHMSYLDYSAFDPIFWLHHTMIDRIFTLWQNIYPDTYIQPMSQKGGTFTSTAGDVEDGSSPLTPFHDDASGSFWTSDSARNANDFGYTYPELISGNQSSASLKAAINTLYGRTAGSTSISKRGVTENLATADSIAVASAVDGRMRHYLANIVSQKFGLEGSYSIYLFMGPFGNDPTKWSVDPNLVGTHSVFASMAAGAKPLQRRHDMPSRDVMQRSHNMPELQVTGTIPLTTMLVNKVAQGELQCLGPWEVSPYLQQNLHWRVALMNGTEFPLDQVPDLSITVVSAEVEPAATVDDFPQWGNFTELTEITHARVGGHNP
ncbi:hypothetical protein LTR66_003012 [Elasticomyces elasticus]|nr:hypothetical protein LTR66_003012 [Elasticomyces elasticus]